MLALIPVLLLTLSLLLFLHYVLIFPMSPTQAMQQRLSIESLSVSHVPSIDKGVSPMFVKKNEVETGVKLLENEQQFGTNMKLTSW